MLKRPNVSLRIEKELKTKLEEAARVNMRSLNGEIVYRLSISFDKPYEHDKPRIIWEDS
jgi:hypothetical protein